MKNFNEESLMKKFSELLRKAKTEEALREEKAEKFKATCQELFAKTANKEK